jgi:signal transduction histidine kinase
LLIASLFAVVFILYVMTRVSRAERTEFVQVTDPARTDLYDLQRILALEMSAQRAYQLAQDPQALQEYRRLRVEEDSVFANLHALAFRVGPDAAEALQRLRGRTERWQSEVERLTPATVSPNGLDERLSTQGQLYSQVLASGTQLEEILQNNAAVRRERLARADRTEMRFVFLLIALALASVVMLVRVGQRLRLLTAQAHALADRSHMRQEEMQRMASEKERFIRGVTHDLKNPLGAVDAYAQLLEAQIKGPLNEEQQQFVARIRRATQETLGTIHDLLELARVEANQIRIEQRSTDPREVVLETTEDYRAPIEAAGLELRVGPLSGLPTIVTDGSRVREILGNVLSNALKYTPSGGTVSVDATVSRTGPLAPIPAVVISISDTGPGIPAADQERIFGEFERGTGAVARGSGLGLAISRRMARLLGGDLTLTSEEGHGTCFWLWLPIPTPLDRVSSSDRELQAG